MKKFFIKTLSVTRHGLEHLQKFLDETIFFNLIEGLWEFQKRLEGHECRKTTIDT